MKNSHIAVFVISLMTSTLRADCPTPIPTSTSTPIVEHNKRVEVFDKRVPEAFHYMYEHHDESLGDEIIAPRGNVKDYNYLFDEFGYDKYRLCGHVEEDLLTIKFVGWDNDYDEQALHIPAKLLYTYNKITGKQFCFFDDQRYWKDVLFDYAFDERVYPIEEGQVWTNTLSDSDYKHRYLKITSCGWKEKPEDRSCNYFVELVPNDKESRHLFLKSENLGIGEVEYNPNCGRYYINEFWLIDGLHLVKH